MSDLSTYAALGLVVALFGAPGQARTVMPTPRGCPTAALTSAAPGPLRVNFYGVSTLLFDDGVTQLLVDGFFSRPNLSRTVLRRIGPEQTKIMARLDEERIGPLEAILVAHAHHDHALDAPMIARLRKAVLVGGRSTANLGWAADLPDTQICQIKDQDRLAFGAYRVRVFKTRHGSTGHLLNWALTGGTPATRTLPTRFWRLKDRENFSYLISHGGRDFLVHPSAGRAAGAYEGVQAQIVFLDVGRMGKQSTQSIGDYWREIGDATGASTVVPIHWDAFTRSLDAPLQPLPWPLDRFERGQQRLAKAITQSDRAVALLRLGARDALLISPDGTVVVDRADQTSASESNIPSRGANDGG